MSEDGKTFICKKEHIDHKVSDNRLEDFKEKFLFNAGGHWHLRVPAIQDPDNMVKWLETNL